MWFKLKNHDNSFRTSVKGKDHHLDTTDVYQYKETHISSLITNIIKIKDLKEIPLTRTHFHLHINNYTFIIIVLPLLKLF